MAIRFGFRASNNESEYEAVITGLKMARAMGARRVHVCSDSQLVINQVKGTYAAKGKQMTLYLERVKELVSGFEEAKFEQIPRELNSNADTLARLTSASDSELTRLIPVEFLPEPSFCSAEVVCPIKLEEEWMEPIVKFLQGRDVPSDSKEFRRMNSKCLRYSL